MALHNDKVVSMIKLYFQSFRTVLILDIQPRTPDYYMVGNEVARGTSFTCLRVRGTYCYVIESSRLCCHLASISLESSTISRLSFTRSMVHFSNL